MYSSGKKCSISGKLYEEKILNVAVKCYFKNNVPFCRSENLGGCTNTVDLLCQTDNNLSIGIEIKKSKAPDWQQCKLVYCKLTDKWTPTLKSRMTYHKLFENLLSESILFNGKVPPFLSSSITHETWRKIKASTSDWNDVYIDIPNDTIEKMYRSKGCFYIQVSDGFGLYHLGDDVCGFNVPEFIVPQQIRVRTKIHCRRNKKGFCSLSVMAACQPKNINCLPKSPFSLDDYDRLPLNLYIKS